MFRSMSYTPAIHSSSGITAAIATPSTSSSTRRTTGDTRRIPSVAPTKTSEAMASTTNTATAAHAHFGYHRQNRANTPIGIDEHHVRNALEPGNVPTLDSAFGPPHPNPKNSPLQTERHDAE